MDKLKAKRKGSTSTQRVFLYYFGRFCHFAKMTPDQLIDERKRHLKSDDEFLRRKHEELVEKFSTRMDLRASSRREELLKKQLRWIEEEIGQVKTRLRILSTMEKDPSKESR